MIRKACDRCDRVIEVDDRKAGQKVECPSCGDMNVMPALPTGSPASGPASSKPATAAAVSRAEAKGYPPDRGPEVEVIRVRHALFRSRPLTSGGTLLLAAVSLVLMLIHLINPVAVPMWAAIASAVVLVGAGGAFVWWWVESLTSRLEVTNKRTVVRRGILSRSTSEVLHDNIRNVQIEQTFWQRLWKIGSIGISSSGQDGIEIHMDRVPHPDRLREIIDLYRPLD